MSRIEKLTPEQKVLIATVRDEWQSKVFDAPGIDREQMRRGIDWLYGLAGLEPPVLIVLDSPLACQIGANMLRGAQVGAQVRDQVWDQVRAQVRAQVGDQVGAQVWAQVWAQVCAQVRAQVGDQVRAQVGAQVWDQVWDQVRAQVGAQVGAQVMEYVDISNRDLWSDSGWCAFYDYFSRIGVVRHSGFDNYVSYLSARPTYTIMLRGYAIVCGSPTHIKRDHDNRLHCEDGPAVLWPDGYGNYFWHGVSIPAKLVEYPGIQNRDDITKEENAEVRRCMMEKLGSKRFAELLGIEEIHRSGIDLDEIILYRTLEPDPTVGDHIQFVKVVCPSTRREYMLCVPPTITNALEAVAWTFGETPETYRPVVQT
jgi:hypothetical protein